MYIYDVSIRRKPLVCGLHGTKPKNAEPLQTKFPKNTNSIHSMSGLKLLTQVDQ